MLSGRIVLAGNGFGAIVEALRATTDRYCIASTPADVLDAVAADPPGLVIARGKSPEVVLSLVQTAAEALDGTGVPVVVVVLPDDTSAPDEWLRLGVSGTIVEDGTARALTAQIEGWLAAGALARSLGEQRTANDRLVVDLLQAKEELGLMQEQLEGVLEAGPVVIYGVEAPPDAGCFTSAAHLEEQGFSHLDRSVASLVGHSAEGLLAQPGRWKSLVHEKDRGRLTTRARRLIAKDRHTCRYRVRDVDGNARWIRDDARLLRREDGAAVAVVGCLRDVTRQRTATRALRGGTGIVRRAQRMQAVQRLAGTVAHDFNNMLAIMMCHTQFAAKLVPAEHPAQKSLGCVLEAAQRAKGGTKLLVQLSQRGTRKGTWADVNTTVRETLSLLDRVLGDGITVVAKLRPRLPKVRMNRVDLEHVLLNLCVNARDAMPGGGALVVSTNVKPGGTSGESSPLSVVVEVTDTGQGMEEDVFKRCFEPFFTTKSGDEGTGLGLFNVLQTVRQCGGAVAAETERNRGTTFRLWLPAVDRRRTPRTGEVANTPDTDSPPRAAPARPASPAAAVTAVAVATLAVPGK